MSKFIPVIGLEVHAELKSNSKNFSSARNNEDEVNTNLTALDIGYPGTLPVVNKEAVKSSLEKIDVDGCGSLEQTHLFTNVTVIEGSGEIDGIKIKKGSSFIIPFNYGTFSLKGSMSIIVSYI